MLQSSAISRKWVSIYAQLARCCLRAAMAGALAAGGVAAQPVERYPERPIKILVPYAPGGATDIIARHLSVKLGEALGQNVVVENRPGASGNIAVDATAKAPPDGYTLLCGNVSTNAINENLFGAVMQSRPSRDLIGITKLVEIPHIVAVNPSFAATALREAIELIRKNPGKFNYASAGLGSYPHLDMLKLLKASGTDMTHVPYKGGAGQMVPSLISNETQIAFINLGSTMEQIKAGRMRAVATTALTRLAELPNVATMAEQGYPGIGTNAWQALFAPVAMPKPIVDKLYNAIAAILSKPEMRDMLARQMLTVMLSGSPQEFTELVQKETQAWGDFIRANKIKID